MKVTITVLLIFYNLILFGQKKELYVNDDFEYISKTEFDKISKEPLDYKLRFELDSAYLNVKVSRYKKGKIELKILDSIKKIFYKNKKFNDNEIFLINYYPGNDRCSTDGYKSSFKSYYSQYRRKFDKIENLKQLFVYKSNDGLKGFGNKINWQSDIDNLIEKTFYPIPYPCGGYVIIDSKGNYISERGEYGYWKGLLNEIKSFTINKPK
ncbi:hypothetical protein [Hyunsoonleella pacifica]|uniref:Uncharacterized protein n=1 Tax=Hyunsoonleella pacifica TaxID=1080224 RepID=A0A4Q9FRT4_9FLAO|nr:hypothetical protein [Hyunsoonleella pacifica]TBN18617.1 hypothetical protein EYD46_00695 [Hyunsoonleella pacifica]GGD03237.1 hypothetical protein GCM10011368_01390 [Hyunsoonleella pacifica]